MPWLQKYRIHHEKENHSIEAPDDESKNENAFSRIQCIAPLLPNLSEVLKSEHLNDLWNEAISNDDRILSEPYDIRGGTFGRNYRREKIKDEKI